MDAIHLREPCLVVLVGPAGAGKTKLAGRFFDDREILSSDRYREMISGDEADQSVTGPAFARLHRDLEKRLNGSGTAVVDATNLRAASRRELLKRAQAAKVPAVAIVLDLPAAVVRARNDGRDGRVVDPDVVARHLDELRKEVDARRIESEGFDAVYVIRDPAALEELVILRSSGPAR
ncbi:MAG: AAA family ATPase [Chloroflexi bacterium]|nr:AAA family ATPase [Chloroflexota bacterium]